MVTAYRIALIHEDFHASAQALETAVTRAARDFPEISNLLEFSSTLTDERTPQVVAYLASAGGRSSPIVNGVIDAALDRDISILPISSPDRPGEIGRQLPARIAHLNAAIWEGDGTQVAVSLLEMLGLVEKERKIFISYGSIRDSQACLGASGCEAGSWRWMPAQDDEMEPPRTAVETLGGDAAEAPREALDLAVAAVDRLDVHGPAHPLALAALLRRQFIDARKPVPKPCPIHSSAPRGQCKSEPSAAHTPAKCEQSLSYCRSETSTLAVQLHTELVQRRFDVFLDRFAVEPGVDFQRRLDEDLGDKAFVLLLESPDLRDSRWVRHEIVYAHSRRIEILALTLPDTTSSELVPTIDDAFRLRLDASDLSDDGSLSPGGLALVLDEIELGHARALRRRREQILGSVTAKLRAAGCICSPADDWCIVARGPSGRSGLFWVTPRRPEPGDSHSLSHHHDRVKNDPGLDNLHGSVVHEVGRLATDHQNLLDWLSGISGKGLATVATCSV